jgi:AcrR family transcriptional regulator
MSSPQTDESLAAMAVRRRTGDRQTSAEDEVRRLLDVGLQLMRDDPNGNPKIADIVRLAKVSNDAFYRAFKSKDDLMAAIVDDGARRLFGYISHQRAKATDPVGEIRACVVAVLQQATDPEIARTTRAVMRHAGHGAAGNGGGVQVRRQVGELIADSLARHGSPDPDRDGLVAASAAFGVMEQFLWNGRTPTEDDLEHLLGWILERPR